MIDMLTCFWFVVGLLAGFLHATMLWRAAHRLTAGMPVLGMLRLGVVVAVLVVAAVFTAILAAAAGWAVGMVTLGLWLVMSRADTTAAAPNVRSNE